MALSPESRGGDSEGAAIRYNCTVPYCTEKNTECVMIKAMTDCLDV